MPCSHSAFRRSVVGASLLWLLAVALLAFDADDGAIGVIGFAGLLAGMAAAGFTGAALVARTVYTATVAVDLATRVIDVIEPKVTEAR